MQGIQLFVALVKKDMENEKLPLEQARIIFQNVMKVIRRKKLEKKEEKE